MACSRHCSSRCVFVNVPAFSTCDAAGKRKTSVSISSVRNSPFAISGESSQNVAVSISTRSRTTSHFNFDSAFRSSRAFGAPTRGVLAHHEQTFEFAVGHVQPVAEVRMVAGQPRQPLKSEVVRLRRRIAVVRLQQRDDVLVDVEPPPLRRFVRLDPLASDLSSVRIGIGR